MSKLVLMCGGPASGKSTVAVRLYGEKMAIVDCDSIKTHLPGYDPKNPSLVHEESSKIAVQMLMGYLSIGADVVYDSTGSNVEKLMALANAARLSGMKVEAVLVTCDVEEAVKRNAARTRTVNEEIVRERHAAARMAWPNVAAMADTTMVVENN